jgi:hypothetical protein
MTTLLSNRSEGENAPVTLINSPFSFPSSLYPPLASLLLPLFSSSHTPLSSLHLGSSHIPQAVKNSGRVTHAYKEIIPPYDDPAIAYEPFVRSCASMCGRSSSSSASRYLSAPPPSEKVLRLMKQVEMEGDIYFRCL